MPALCTQGRSLASFRCGSVLSSWGTRAALSTQDAGPGASCWRRPPLAAFVGVRAAAFSPRWTDRPGARSGAGGEETETKNPRAHSRGLNAFMFCLNHGRMGEGQEGPSVPGGGWPPARAARAVGGQRQRFSSAQCSRWQSRARLGSCCWRESHSTGHDVTRRCQGPGGWQLCCPPPGRLQSHWAPPLETF